MPAFLNPNEQNQVESDSVYGGRSIHDLRHWVDFNQFPESKLVLENGGCETAGRSERFLQIKIVMGPHAMFKMLFNLVRKRLSAVREGIHGRPVRDFGAVWKSTDGKQAFFASVGEQAGACIISLYSGHPKWNPSKGLIPMGEGGRLTGDFSEVVSALSSAVALCRSGGSIPSPPGSAGIGVSKALFHRGVTDLRLVFARMTRKGATRLFCGFRKEQILLLVDDTFRSYDVREPIGDAIFEAVSGSEIECEWLTSTQSSNEWPLEGFVAAVAAMEGAQAEISAHFDAMR